MINTLEEFKKEHPKAVVVNYDIADIFDCGMTYRASTGNVEYFRKDYSGKYLVYPYIQPYLTLSDSSSFELFMIHNSKMYELELGSKPNTYRIKRELENVSSGINTDDVFYATKLRKKPTIISEDIYMIEE